MTHAYQGVTVELVRRRHFPSNGARSACYARVKKLVAATISRVCASDQPPVSVLVKSFSPLVHRVVRSWLTFSASRFLNLVDPVGCMLLHSLIII